MGEGSALEQFAQFAPGVGSCENRGMQILSQRSDVPFRRGTEKLLKERKTKHDRLKKTNLIVFERGSSMTSRYRRGLR